MHKDSGSEGESQTGRVPPAQQRPDVPDGGRRRFLGAAGGVAAVTVAGLPPLAVVGGSTRAHAGEESSGDAHIAFRKHAYAVRSAAADADFTVAIAPHPVNGDEQKYANLIGSDTRGLPHDERGEVDRAAFDATLKAYASGDPADFEAIPLGGKRKQLNPIGSLAVNLTGCVGPQFTIPPAPTLDSATRASEAVELYWQSLLRDAPLSELTNDTGNKDVLAAVDELNRLAAFNGPRRGESITPETLFRGTALYVDAADPSGQTGRYVTPPGTLTGPYISQFLLKDAPYGSQLIPARIRTAAAGTDFHTFYDEWLAIQNGIPPAKSTSFDPTPRYIATGRDLAEYVHNNPAVFWSAALLLGVGPDKANAEFGGFGIPFSKSNPYLKSKTQTGGYSTFGLPYAQSLLPVTASLAIRVAYWQKFYVHRALRPEAYGGLIHHRIANKVDAYPVHGDILNSAALARSVGKFGTHLLSHVYPEGAPIHSSYPGGAAQIAASNVTILKALFDEDATIPNPLQPDPKDPTKLIPYQGEPLTVGGELNKLAWNYGIGRDWAGIHWRSDFSASLALGEALAINVLRNERHTYREQFEKFTFTRFDGTRSEV
ncbi:vanadium-dependent haloperoxidase [Mesorhizobium sp.]|uniref:vanadium-dependent haloperoxidase n=1 Tax=Mesorhizobium sp. TaxID=1871066 RepID=UPI000FEA166B|nr:vanadium-dependent haloperoxidase [Mesorhizobium sp.]RWP60387.1 MAG: twin-arginine translocation pathway signal protein [Mesorhizobium sp.]